MISEFSIPSKKYSISGPVWRRCRERHSHCTTFTNHNQGLLREEARNGGDSERGEPGRAPESPAANRKNLKSARGSHWNLGGFIRPEGPNSVLNDQKKIAYLHTVSIGVLRGCTRPEGLNMPLQDQKKPRIYIVFRPELGGFGGAPIGGPPKIIALALLRSSRLCLRPHPNSGPGS